MLTKQVQLKGLDCANCAAKIETEVNLIPGLEASVNLMTQTLTLELPTEDAYHDALPSIEQIVHKHEPDVQVIPKDPSPLSEAKAAAPTSAPLSVSSEAQAKAITENDTETEAEAKTEYDTDTESPWDELRPTIIRLVAGGALLAIALIAALPAPVELALYLISYLIVGAPVLVSAAKQIVKGQVFSEHFLMTIATIGAFIIGEYPEAISVMLFYLLGELFQDAAVGHSRRSITALLKIRPETANLLVGEGSETKGTETGKTEIREVRSESVKPGDHIVVRPGERIPLDGIIVSGSSTADTSVLTGESVPRTLAKGDEALSGYVNQAGLLTIKVTKPFADSTVSKILDLVQNASSKKAPTEKFITKFARYYTPVVVFAALALAIIPPLVIPGATFGDWVYRALVFLVVSCPCALVVSIPLGFFGGIGGASRQGILIKGSNYLEALNDVDTVVFDKTGTLTQGSFEVTEIVPAKAASPNSLLELAAHTESFSNHPIARSIQRRYGQALDLSRVEQGREIAGGGLAALVDGKAVLAGNARLLGEHGITCTEPETIGTVVHLAVDGAYAGHIVVSDRIKADSATAVADLKALGIQKTVMLTGDARPVAQAIAQEIHVDEVYSELLPADKVARLEALQLGASANLRQADPASQASQANQASQVAATANRRRVAAVGDGINDAPLLARADVGIAMGGLGSDAAIEAADIVIMTDEPSKVADAIRIARRTRRIVYQNIVIALGIKAIFLLLGAFGVAGMWEAVFADVGVTVLAVLNAIRAMRV